MTDESPSGTQISSWDQPPIIDQWGNAWSITRQSQIDIDGMRDRTLLDVEIIAYINRRIWVETGQKLWYSKANLNAPWLPRDGTTTPPFGPSPDPRLDTLIVLLDTFAQTAIGYFAGISNTLGSIEGDTRLDAILMGQGILGSAIQNLQNTTDEIPRETIPDPRPDEILTLLRLLTGDRIATSVRFAVPTYRNLNGDPWSMAQNIINNAVTIIPIEFDNSGSTAVQKPAGSTDTVTVDNTAAFTVAMSADGMAVEVTPVQPPVAGAVGTLTYTNSVITVPSILAIVMTTDPTAVSDHFNTLAVTTRPLPAATPAPTTPLASA